MSARVVRLLSILLALFVTIPSRFFSKPVIVRQWQQRRCV